METALSLFFTTLFNPALLGLLLILFFAGKLLGKLSVRMNIWKFLLLAYFAIFLIQPLRDAGWFIGGVFLLGFFSNHIRRLPGILSWATSLGDIYFAYKYRKAFDDIRAHEREEQAHARREKEEAARQNTGRSKTQDSWRNEKGRRGENNETHQKTRGNERGGHGRSSGEEYTRFNPQGNNRSESSRNKGANQGPGTSSDPTRDMYLIILGLKPGRDYSAADIKSAWKRAAKKNHPDAGGSSADFIKIKSAWSYLGMGK